MAQRTINVGTVANDGTGDTIRGAFTNVNANFTEVYGNIATVIPAYTTANAAYAGVNTVNSIVQTVAVGANSYSASASANANAYAVTVGTSGNAYAVAIGASGNSYAQSVGTSGNLYASILAANNAVGANGWTNTVSATTYAWANSTFTTLTNTAIVYNTTNAAFAKANTSFQNTSGTLNGDIIVSGNVKTLVGFDDGFGPLRERVPLVANTHNTVAIPYSTVIANSSTPICIYIPNDKHWISLANIGTTIEIFQYGSGNTKIAANDGFVTVHSSNNWANIAGQYLSAKVIKVLANTWILTGDLKP